MVGDGLRCVCPADDRRDSNTGGFWRSVWLVPCRGYGRRPVQEPATLRIITSLLLEPSRPLARVPSRVARDLSARRQFNVSAHVAVHYLFIKFQGLHAMDQRVAGVTIARFALIAPPSFSSREVKRLAEGY